MRLVERARTPSPDDGAPSEQMLPDDAEPATRSSEVPPRSRKLRGVALLAAVLLLAALLMSLRQSAILGAEVAPASPLSAGTAGP